MTAPKLTEAQRAALEAFEQCEGRRAMTPYQGETLLGERFALTLHSLEASGLVRFDSTKRCWWITDAGRAALRGDK